MLKSVHIEGRRNAAANGGCTKPGRASRAAETTKSAGTAGMPPYLCFACFLLVTPDGF